MGTTLIIDDLELAPVLGNHLPTSKGWNAELAQQCEEIGKALGMNSMENQNQVARTVAQWFTHYATATCV